MWPQSQCKVNEWTIHMMRSWSDKLKWPTTKLRFKWHSSNLSWSVATRIEIWGPSVTFKTEFKMQITVVQTPPSWSWSSILLPFRKTQNKKAFFNLNFLEEHCQTFPLNQYFICSYLVWNQMLTLVFRKAKASYHPLIMDGAEPITWGQHIQEG